ncbi:glycerate kinase [Microbacterium sp. HA-8]|uniref:glycerate kinase n=1 Tax=Microbacterium sp. HA-8 TaxID=3234200 RepID=UPI0038F74357
MSPPPRSAASRRYLVAPDKFKGTLTGAEAAAAIAEGILRADPGAQLMLFPFADGGEGTVEAVVLAGGERRVNRVTGPLGGDVDASWAMYEGTAFIEMAESSGLRHVRPTPASALRADTRGTGELIAHALDDGVDRIVIGLGGSATTDGGFGALRALGIRFVDVDGTDLTRVEDADRTDRIDTTRAHPRLGEVDIRLCSDVLSPLHGPDGAASVFGPQKGADTVTVARLQRRLEHLGALYDGLAGADADAARTRGGAAGGLAAGMIAVLGAHIESGVEVLAQLLGLDERILAADAVIVGEGSLDEQSRFGKTPVGIARRAQRLGIPVVAVVGTTDLAPHALADDGIGGIFSAVAHAPTPDDALRDPTRYVAAAAESAARYMLAPPIDIR